MDELYAKAPCGYLATKPDGTILRANERFAMMVGQSVDELVATARFHELLSIGSQMYFETHVRPLLHMQGFVDQIALDFRGSHDIVPALVNAIVRFDDTGKPARIDAIVVDATERRRYEREIVAARNQAEEAARIKGELVSMVSHDMRSSIAAIATVGELLECSGLSVDQAKYVRILRTSTGNLLGMIDDVLDYGRLEAGRMHLERKPFDLRKSIEILAEEIRVQAERKGLMLRTTIDDRLPSSLLGDRIKIGRILGNLLGNAIKFTDEGCVRLDLRLAQVDAESIVVEIEISDTGIGIPDDRLGNIFEDFIQGDDDIGRRYGGSGLGLGICKRLLELHGATLRVKSEPGRGSSFRFRLRLDLA